MAFPTSVQYLERLTGQEQHVVVPQSRHEAFELVGHIQSFAKTDPDQWKTLVRKHTATSWYVMALFTQAAQRRDPFTGRVEIDHDFQFEFSQLMQFEGEMTLDYSFRQAFKTFWRALVGITVEVVRDPDLTCAIVSAEKFGSTSSGRTGLRTMLEWENNVELKTAWDDVFYADPKRQADTWVKDTGCRVKQKIHSLLPTLSWHAIDHAPTGSRVGLFLVDDPETKETVTTKEIRDKSFNDFTTFLETAGRAPRIWINATIHHQQGLIRRVIETGYFRCRCITLEDTSVAPEEIPDIAALCEEAGWIMPLRDETRQVPIPEGLAKIRLDGKPRFLHPLEVAQKRMLAMTEPGGLANYYMHNMGDPLKYSGTKLRKEWFRRYAARPVDRGEGAWLYPVIDASKGINDPTWMMMWAALPDGTLSLVDSLRAKLSPSQIPAKAFEFCSRWRDIGAIRHGRVEIYAQAIWDDIINQYITERGWNDFTFHGIAGKGANDLGRKGGGNRIMEWAVIEPAARQGKLWLPEQGIIEEDEFGVTYDSVAYLLDREIDDFPQPKTDDGLAALRILLWPGDRAKGIPEVEFPEDLETRRVRELDARMVPAGPTYEGEDSWMGVGLW